MVTSEVLDLMMTHAFSLTAVERFGDGLRVELLKMSTLLLESMGRELVERRKGLITFGWTSLKQEDLIVKHWAYVNVCRFVAIYETPGKIILQVATTDRPTDRGAGQGSSKQQLVDPAASCCYCGAALSCHVR